MKRHMIRTIHVVAMEVGLLLEAPLLSKKESTKPPFFVVVSGASAAVVVDGATVVGSAVHPDRTPLLYATVPVNPVAQVHAPGDPV